MMLVEGVELVELVEVVELVNHFKPFTFSQAGQIFRLKSCTFYPLQ